MSQLHPGITRALPGLLRKLRPLRRGQRQLLRRFDVCLRGRSEPAGQLLALHRRRRAIGVLHPERRANDRPRQLLLTKRERHLRREQVQLRPLLRHVGGLLRRHCLQPRADGPRRLHQPRDLLQWRWRSVPDRRGLLPRTALSGRWLVVESVNLRPMHLRS